MNMKKIIIMVMLMGVAALVRAQLVVNLQLPAIGLSLKSQLWSMTLINTTNAPMTVKVSLTYTDVANGLPVFAGAATQVVLPAGAKQLQYADFMPVQYNVLNASYNVSSDPNGFLPAGRYNVCYEFFRIINDGTEKIAEECETADVEPVGPPMLSSPFDQSEADALHPLFTWLPPTPPFLFGNLTYDFKLVELFTNQSPGDAVQQNMALYQQQNLTTAMLQYPASQPPLDTAKRYAWQVIARNNGNYVAKSETWTFKVKLYQQSPDVFADDKSYSKLQQQLNVGYFLCNGWLKFYYLNEYGDSTAHLSIFDISDGKRTRIVLPADSIPLINGRNLINMDMRQNTMLKKDHIYQLELLNRRGELWIGKFRYTYAD
jgi:hypothetical protein